MTARLEDLKPDALFQAPAGREAVRIVCAGMPVDLACRVAQQGQAC